MRPNASSSSAARGDAPEPTRKRGRTGYLPTLASLARRDCTTILGAASSGWDLLASAERQMNVLNHVGHLFAADKKLLGVSSVDTLAPFHETLADVADRWPTAGPTLPMAEAVKTSFASALGLGSAEMPLPPPALAKADIMGINASSLSDITARSPVLDVADVVRSCAEIGMTGATDLTQWAATVWDEAQPSRLASRALLAELNALDAPWQALHKAVGPSLDDFSDLDLVVGPLAKVTGDFAQLVQGGLASGALDAFHVWDRVLPIDLDGTEFGALRIVEDESASPERRMQAVNRLVDGIIWVPRSYEVRAALLRRAKEEDVSVRTIKWQELQAAVFIVLARKKEPMFLRRGQQWLVLPDPDSQYVDWGTGGQRVRFAPESLPLDEYLDWLKREMVKAAEASVLGKPYPFTPDAMERRVSLTDHVGSEDDDDDEIETLPDASQDPLLVLLDRDDRREVQDRLLAALRDAPPRTRQLLHLIARGMDVPTAARQLGIKPATARVHLHRLRKKAM